MTVATSAFRRPPRGAIVIGAGAAVLALAIVLPWISIPGGTLVRELMTLQREPIPATGAAWTSLPLASVLLAVLVLVGLLVALLITAARRVHVLVAGAAACYGLVVFAVLIDKLFARRVASEFTAIGAGGYLGVIGVVTITLGALIVVRDARVGPRPAPAAEAVAAPAAPAGPRASPSVDAPARSWIWPAVAGAALLAAYLATRLSFADRFPYFLDEGLYADYANQAAQSRDKLFVSLEIGQGPVLTWLSVAWVKLGFAPLTAVRLVSVMSGLLTVAVLGVLGRLLWGTTVGWVAAALCVVLPFFVVHDGIGIYEPLVTLIMASALLLQIALARRPDPRLGALLGVVLGVGVLTKQNTLPALALLPISLLCFDWSEPGRRRRIFKWLLAVAIAIGLVVAADLVQHSSRYYVKREEAMQDIFTWPARSVTDVLNDPFGVIGQNWATYRPALIGYLTVPIILTTLAGAVLSWRNRPRLTLVLLAWLLVPFAVGMLFQLRPFPRHAMFLVPPALVLSAYALVEGCRLAGRRLPRLGAAIASSAAVGLVLAPAVILDGRVLAHPATARYPGLDYWQYVAGWPAGGPWDGAADLIRRRATGRRVVVLTPGPYSVLSQMLGDRYTLATPRSPLARRARLGVVDMAGFPVDPKGFDVEMARRHFVPMGRFARPRGPCSGAREPSCGGAVIVFARRAPR